MLDRRLVSKLNQNRYLYINENAEWEFVKRIKKKNGTVTYTNYTPRKETLKKISKLDPKVMKEIKFKRMEWNYQDTLLRSCGEELLAWFPKGEN